MEAVLRLIVPKIAAGLSFAVYPYQCKQDLLKKLPDRLRAYASWLPDDWRIVIVVDRDDDPCRVLKRNLDMIALQAGLSTRTQSPNRKVQVVNRLAIEELEAWFFGDWQAVQAAYPKVAATIPAKQGYRDPDAIDGTWEALERLLQKVGYFRTGLRKIEAARAIAEHMDPQRNRSISFQMFRNALGEMAANSH